MVKIKETDMEIPDLPTRLLRSCSYNEQQDAKFSVLKIKNKLLFNNHTYNNTTVFGTMHP